MLRALAESFVVSPPSGVTIKARLRPTPAEEQALREVGTFLGSLYRADLVRRLGEGKLDAQGRAASRRERKRGLNLSVVVAVGWLDNPGDPGPVRPRGAGTGCRAGHARRGDRQTCAADRGPGRRSGRQDRRVPQRGRAA